MAKEKTAVKDSATLFEDTPGAQGTQVHVIDPEKKPKHEVATAKPVKTSKRSEVVRVEPPNLIQSLFAAISDPSCQPEKLHALLDARDRVMKEQAHVQFVRAYIGMQAKLPTISKDGLLDQGTTRSGRQGAKARYATYENINAVTKPVLSEHGFGMLLLPDTVPDGAGIVIRGQLVFVCETQYGDLVHTERCTIHVPPDTTGGKNAPQGVGASLSYGKRYGAIALLNLVSFDPKDADRDAARVETPVSVEQLEKIVEYAGRIGCPEQKLVAYLNEKEDRPKGSAKIDAIKQLPASRFDEAMNALAGYEARQSERQQQGGKS